MVRTRTFTTKKVAMESNDAGFRELLKKALLLVARGIGDFADSEEFMEEISKINEEMAEKYGCAISNIIMTTKVVTAEIEIIDENKPAQRSKATPKIDVGTAEDKEFLRELKISANEAEISELKADLEKARQGNGDPAPEGKTQQTDSGPIFSGGAKNQPKKLTDLRSLEEIIDSILGFAYKLNWDSRLFFANNLNATLSGQVPHFPENERLADDKFWLSKVEELIKVSVDAKKNKSAFLNLELIFKKIYESQESGT